MDRALPEFNTILHKRWVNDVKKMHKEKLKSTTARVDNNVPDSYKYPIVKSKKEMLIEGKSNSK